MFAVGFIGWECLNGCMRKDGALRPRFCTVVAAGLRRVLPLALGVTFLVLPSTSTRIFRTFLCESIDYDDDGTTKRYLYADLTLSCSSDEYKATRNTAIAMLLVWPVATPLLYAGLIWASRGALRRGTPTELSSAIAFLSGDYSVSAFWWEPLEMCRKLTLTGASMPHARTALFGCFSSHELRWPLA